MPNASIGASLLRDGMGYSIRVAGVNLAGTGPESDPTQPAGKAGDGTVFLAAGAHTRDLNSAGSASPCGAFSAASMQATTLGSIHHGVVASLSSMSCSSFGTRWSQHNTIRGQLEVHYNTTTLR